jgi:pimeloyl-ACP methyl ester carboxylesterase
MGYVKHTTYVDVTAAMPEAARGGEPVTIAATVVADPAKVAGQPVVVFAIPGGTYHRRYWDLHPPGRTGYSQAEWMADRGVIFVASDYLGGGDSSRPDDGDFMTLEVAADAAHSLHQRIRDELEAGSVDAQLAPVTDGTYIGLGQSLGGFITMIQQAKYADYAGIAILGASPILIAHIPHHRQLEGISTDERRRMIMEDNAKTSGLPELPMYHGAPRDVLRDIFHVKDVEDDLLAYDEEQCHTLISRVTGVDGMTPGYARPFAELVECPVLLGWGDVDVSTDPHLEPSAYPRSRHVTLSVVEDMAHMHNFAATREQLWEDLVAWLPVAVRRRR